MPQSGDVTLLLKRLCDGESGALEDLMPLLYNELRTLAQIQLRNERAGHTLNPTALVNEAFLKLVKQDQIHAQHRTQFMAVAARTMRRILVDYARTKKRIKRGGNQQPLPLDEARHAFSDKDVDELLALDEAIERLSNINKRASEVVVQRFYTGLSMKEIAQIFDVSVKTIQRDWLMARAWLRKEVAHQLQF